jgi:hypothetical protein
MKKYYLMYGNRRSLNLFHTMKWTIMKFLKMLLKSHILEIGKPELNRILNFSFGSEFGSHYVNNKFSDIEHLYNSTEIKELYTNFLNLKPKREREKRKSQLDTIYMLKKFTTALTEQANQLATIRNQR